MASSSKRKDRPVKAASKADVKAVVERRGPNRPFAAKPAAAPKAAAPRVQEAPAPRGVANGNDADWREF